MNNTYCLDNSHYISQNLYKLHRGWKLHTQTLLVLSEMGLRWLKLHQDGDSALDY